MSTAAVIQSNPTYNFSMEKPTQSETKKLLITQSGQGLKMAVQENGQVYQIDKNKIDGLPKTSLVPKAFFDSCFARISEQTVYLCHPLKGGGAKEDLIEALKANLMEDFPDDSELNPEGKELSEKEVSLVLEAFGRVYDAQVSESKGEESAKLEAEKFANSGEKDLIGAFAYVMKRSEGKYIFGLDDAIIFALITAATTIASAYIRGRRKRK